MLGMASVCRLRYSSAMDGADPGTFVEADFTIGSCEACARDVLTFPEFDRDGLETPSCVHCGSAVCTGLRPATGEDLPDLGYGLLELQGCGNPDCGGGRCSREMMDEVEDNG